MIEALSLMSFGITCFLVGVFAGGCLVTGSIGKDCRRGFIKAEGRFYRVQEMDGED
ncbi:hypothetical protein [Halomonas caseinilytica]|uniref:hypothetical protein n=1 Tax=Halomonas caseinilytica TaxID=438744 RepID=UPI00147C3BD7|nr:hypothetical protein [Halomonas caseinilytica]